MQLIKHLTILLSFLFSLNSFAAGDLITCTKDDTAKSYNNLYDKIEETQDIIKNINLIYDLARTAFCINKNTDGMLLLQRAVDKGHIPAIYLLGIYHRYNQTFYSSEYSDNLENIDKAIYYYTKASSND